MLKHIALAGSSLVLALALAPAQAAKINTSIAWTNTSGVYAEVGPGLPAAEIVAYDPTTKQTYVTDASLPGFRIINAAGQTIDTISVAGVGSPNSIAVKNGVVALALQDTNPQATGTVRFYDTDGTFRSSVDVGHMPDMLTFDNDGSRIVVANEGEPNDAYTVDPEGSISIIDIPADIGTITNANVTDAGFTAFNSETPDIADPQGWRVFGPGATVAEDLEPEYVAIAGDTAYVTLQENNAIAIVDLNTNEVTEIVGLGTKDHSLPGNALDASNDDGAINIQNWPVKGMFQPDSIAAYSVGGETFLVTANEGDSRDYSGFSEEKRVGDLTLDPSFTNADPDIQDDSQLGRLKITTTEGDTNNDNVYEELYSYGTRSFSIWDADGVMVWDSGDDFEQTLASLPLLARARR